MLRVYHFYLLFPLVLNFNFPFYLKERKINFVTQCAEPKPPFFKMKLPGVLMSWTSVLMFIILALITVIAIILYRMAMIVALSTCDDDEIKYVHTYDKYDIDIFARTYKVK